MSCTGLVHLDLFEVAHHVPRRYDREMFVRGLQQMSISWTQFLQEAQYLNIYHLIESERVYTFPIRHCHNLNYLYFISRWIKYVVISVPWCMFCLFSLILAPFMIQVRIRFFNQFFSSEKRKVCFPIPYPSEAKSCPWRWNRQHVQGSSRAIRQVDPAWPAPSIWQSAPEVVMQWLWLYQTWKWKSTLKHTTISFR